MSKPFSISLLTVLLLVALRVTIGGHFFTQGLEKLEPGFSSAGFLSQAKGPLAEQYQAFLPDFHKWNELMATPHQMQPNRHEPGSPEWVEQNEEPYINWYNQVAAGWKLLQEQAAAHYQFNAEQRAQAEKTLDYYKTKLKTYLDDEAEAIAEYRHELHRLGNLKSSDIAGQTPFQDERIADKTREASAKGAGVKGYVTAMETDFRRELRLLASPEQYAAAGDLGPTPAKIEQVDKAVTYLVLAVGVCLVMGLFTRLAAFTGAMFLLSVILSQPPWVPGTAPVANQVVEMVAMLALATSRVGRWGGLDFIVHALFVAPFQSKA